MARIVLTADRGGSFTEYAGVSTLGYVACMPARLVPPRLMMDKMFTPPNAYHRNGGEATVAPLRAQEGRGSPS